MAKNVLQKHWDGTQWIEIHPITKSTNVLDSQGQSIQAQLDSHKDNTNNPHSVTKAQVGLGNVDNVKQASQTAFNEHTGDTTIHTTTSEKQTWNSKYSKPSAGIPKSDLSQEVQDILDDSATDEALEDHIEDTDNPHAVTKAQVGLANVDNVKQASKTEFDSHTENTTVHITASERTNWNGKYTKPSTGIPKSDLSTEVQDILDDTATDQALQSHIEDNDNPHAVTKSQVGLGNVDNVKQASQVDFVSHSTDFVLHKNGFNVNQSGQYSNAEGDSTIASGRASHAEGFRSEATGEYSHAEGSDSKAIGTYAHAEGSITEASGEASHAGGRSSKAQGDFSFARGYFVETNVYCSFAIGKHNKTLEGLPDSFDGTSDAFVIGNGPSYRANAFRVTFDGKVYGLSAFNSTGADYAEYFEWHDGNSEDEDRVGYFVTLDGDKIRKATSSDDYILGIISANPSVIGDSHQDDWFDKYVRDDWGRIQYHWVDVPAALDEEGNETEPARKDYLPIINPDWNKEEQYIKREDRPEWDAVGIVGKLLVRDDGTCQANGYCMPNDDGIATISQSGYRVMERVSDNIIRIFVK